MAWIVTAIAAGVAAVGGWGTVAAVGSAAYGAYSSAKTGSAAQQAAEDAGKHELAFAQRQYDDWQDIYGGIEENLSDYYNSITPAYTETQGLQAFEQEKNAQLTGLRENLAQRGISTSGIAAETEKDFAIASASERAKIRAEAPMKAANEKAKFLQIGLGQDPAGDVQQVLSNQAAVKESQFRTAGKSRDEAVAGFTETALDVFGKVTGGKG